VRYNPEATIITTFELGNFPDKSTTLFAWTFKLKELIDDDVAIRDLFDHPVQ